MRGTESLGGKEEEKEKRRERKKGGGVGKGRKEEKEKREILTRDRANGWGFQLQAIPHWE